MEQPLNLFMHLIRVAQEIQPAEYLQVVVEAEQENLELQVELLQVK